MKRQKTLDDSQPVLESSNFPPEPLSDVNKIKHRPRTALEVYDEIEAKLLIEEDPLY